MKNTCTHLMTGAFSLLILTTQAWAAPESGSPEDIRKSYSDPRKVYEWHSPGELQRERDALDSSRDHLDSDRARFEADQAQRSAEQCPEGFTPSNEKCTAGERARGCKDLRLPSGIGCVKRVR